jgi:hypothetical protein
MRGQLVVLLFVFAAWLFAVADAPAAELLVEGVFEELWNGESQEFSGLIVVTEDSGSISLSVGEAGPGLTHEFTLDLSNESFLGGEGEPDGAFMTGLFQLPSGNFVGGQIEIFAIDLYAGSEIGGEADVSLAIFDTGDDFTGTWSGNGSVMAVPELAASLLGIIGSGLLLAYRRR